MNIEELSDDSLEELYRNIQIERYNRKYKAMFDVDALDELTEFSQELGLYDEEGEQ